MAEDFVLVTRCVTACLDPLACSGEKCVRQNPPMPQSSKEKQEAFRARQAMLGHTEVRGIFAPPDLHAAIKEAAKKMVAKHKPEDKK